MTLDQPVLAGDGLLLRAPEDTGVPAVVAACRDPHGRSDRVLYSLLRSDLEGAR